MCRSTVEPAGADRPSLGGGELESAPSSEDQLEAHDFPRIHAPERGRRLATSRDSFPTWRNSAHLPSPRQRRVGSAAIPWTPAASVWTCAPAYIPAKSNAAATTSPDWLSPSRHGSRAFSGASRSSGFAHGQRPCHRQRTHLHRPRRTRTQRHSPTAVDLRGGYLIARVSALAPCNSTLRSPRSPPHRRALLSAVCERLGRRPRDACLGRGSLLSAKRVETPAFPGRKKPRVPAERRRSDR